MTDSLSAVVESARDASRDAGGDAVIPEPRPPADPAQPRRRHRPADQYWDVFEARWRAVVEPAPLG
jgi:hypothetical protein